MLIRNIAVQSTLYKTQLFQNKRNGEGKNNSKGKVKFKSMNFKGKQSTEKFSPLYQTYTNGP